MEYVNKGAEISPCGKYRYMLWREWRGTHDPNHWKWLTELNGKVCVDGGGRPLGEPKPCVFIMLNPSTADGLTDDPTIRKCVGFAAQWKYEKLIVVNLFAYRATNPQQLYAVEDPVGYQNQHWVRRAVQDAGRVICAWGSHGALHKQHQTMMGWLDAEDVQPIHIGNLTSNGQPKHPLYLSYGLPISRYNPSL